MEYKHFRGPGFTLEIPTDWFISSSPEFQAIFVAPPTPNPVQPNLVIAVRFLQPGATVNDVAAETQAIQSAEYPQYHILAEHDYTQTGGVAIQRLYQWVSEEGTLVLQHQTFVLIGQVLYTLTATRLAGDSPDDQAVDDAFVHMMRSFQPQGQLT
jgi:hypothetical protein